MAKQLDEGNLTCMFGSAMEESDEGVNIST